MAERKIQGRTVRFDRLPADQGVRMLLRFLKVMGPVHGTLRVIQEREAQPELGAYDGILATVAARIDETEIASMLGDLAKECMIDGMEAIPGMMTTEELVEVALFAAQVEFGATLRNVLEPSSAVLMARPA